MSEKKEIGYLKSEVLQAFTIAAHRNSNKVINLSVHTAGNAGENNVHLVADWCIGSVAICAKIDGEENIEFNVNRNTGQKLYTCILTADEWLSNTDTKKQDYIKTLILTAVELGTASIMMDYAFIKLSSKMINLDRIDQENIIMQVIGAHMRTMGKLARVTKEPIENGHVYTLDFVYIPDCLRSDRISTTKTFKITRDKYEFYLSDGNRKDVPIDRKMLVEDFVNICIGNLYW